LVNVENYYFTKSEGAMRVSRKVLEGRGAFMGSDRLGQSSPSRDGLSKSNDDSSVVSLKALVAKADPNVSSGRARSGEDSGLIDLRQLMASAPPPSSDALPPVLAPSEAGLFAVPEATFPPQVAAANGLASETPSSTSSTSAKWFVAGAALSFVAVIMVGVLQYRTNRADSSQSNVASVVPASPVEANQPLETAAPILPKAPEEAVAAPTAEAPPVAIQPRTARPIAIPRVARNSAPKETSTAEHKPDEKIPPPSPCDLMCEIQRAAQKKAKQ
jgi:hypothetical protein